MSASSRNGGHAFQQVVWDLWLVGLFTAFSAALALLPGTAGHPIRIAAAIVFVLFIPGYAFISAIFPEASTEDEHGVREGGAEIESPEGDTPEKRGIDGIERLAFGFGLSVALTGLMALGLNFTPWGIRLFPLVIALSTFTIVSLVVAGYRRIKLLRETQRDDRDRSKRSPVSEPYIPPFHRLRPLARDLRDELLGRNADSRTEKVLTVALVLSILLAAASIGWALSTPRPGADYTEFYLLTRGDDGSLVAGDYPTNLTAGAGADVVLTVTNHEFETVTYSVLIRLRDPANNRTARMQTIQDIRLQHNTSWQEQLSLVPPFAGDELRIEFLLYRDGKADGPVYRRLHLIVNVSNPS